MLSSRTEQISMTAEIKSESISWRGLGGGGLPEA